MANRKFKLFKNYYEENDKLYKKSSITINSGITVFVGCNGIGKTTLFRQIISQLKEQNIPYLKFDNLQDGGANARESAGFFGDFNFVATALQSSEGENIIMNVRNLASRLGQFVKTGEDPKGKYESKLANAVFGMQDDNAIKNNIPKERWILLDAIDSGLSVDNIVDIKEQLFKTILEHNFDNDIYIVVSANEYEMARNENCFDVYNGKYINFKDYDDYRDFILKSKEQKLKRDK